MSDLGSAIGRAGTAEDHALTPARIAAEAAGEAAIAYVDRGDSLGAYLWARSAASWGFLVWGAQNGAFWRK